MLLLNPPGRRRRPGALQQREHQGLASSSMEHSRRHLLRAPPQQQRRLWLMLRSSGWRARCLVAVAVAPLAPGCVAAVPQQLPARPPSLRLGPRRQHLISWEAWKSRRHYHHQQQHRQAAAGWTC
jgi:hypothetical protein